jgi:hypothetical protein|tara:strand:+ start:29220 stop:30128 length:909 start_codon:yes stop_codon:yes gene_type:complete
MSSLIELTNTRLKEFKVVFIGLLNLLKDNFVKLVFSTLLGLSIGVLYSFTLTPQFLVSATINQNDEVSSSGGIGKTNSLLNSLLTDEAGGGDFDRLFGMMFSYATAEAMWNKGYGDILYGGNYDETEDKYLREPNRWERISSLVLGYEIDREITPTNLRSHLKGAIDHGKDRDYPGTQNIYVYTSNPELYKRMLLDLLIVSDDLFKEQKLSYARKQIDYLEEQLKLIADIEIKGTIVDSIKSKYLNIALLSNDLPYSYKITDYPQVSPNPISPNLKFIYYFFSFIGFSIVFLRAIIKEIFSD